MAPVVVDADDQPRYRYNRAWIDLAGRRLHGEVPADVRAACDALDAALERGTAVVGSPGSRRGAVRRQRPGAAPPRRVRRPRRRAPVASSGASGSAARSRTRSTFRSSIGARWTSTTPRRRPRSGPRPARGSKRTPSRRASPTTSPPATSPGPRCPTTTSSAAGGGRARCTTAGGPASPGPRRSAGGAATPIQEAIFARSRRAFGVTIGAVRGRHRHGRADAAAARHPEQQARCLAADAARRRGVVPAVQRARGRLRPRLAAHPGRARRRRVGRQRPEGVDVERAARRVGHPHRPHRPRRRPSTRASPTSSSTCDRRASTSARSAR